MGSDRSVLIAGRSSHDLSMTMMMMMMICNDEAEALLFSVS